jgi:hypothetical protein
MTTPATITAMADTGIITVTIITTMAIRKKPALFHGGAWVGRRCSWHLPLPPRVLFKCARGRRQ